MTRPVKIFAQVGGFQLSTQREAEYSCWFRLARVIGRPGLWGTPQPDVRLGTVGAPGRRQVCPASGDPLAVGLGPSLTRACGSGRGQNGEACGFYAADFRGHGSSPINADPIVRREG